MDTLRKPFQGVWNIVRFNWHFYLFASIMATVLLFLSTQFDSRLSIVFISLSVVIVLVNLISLLISYYVYDTSDLYELPWLTPFRSTRNLHIVNINAGFDETSSLITKKFNECHLKVLDFYDPKKHTEVSVKRARKAYPPYPKTISVQTDKIEMQDASTDMICAILSAHEIRNQKERVQFFRELKRMFYEVGAHTYHLGQQSHALD